MDIEEPARDDADDFRAWMERFRLGDAEYTTSRMVMQLNLYLKDAWTNEVRTRVAKVTRDFVDRFRDYISFTYTFDPTGEFYRIKPFGKAMKNEPEEFLLRRAKEGDEALLCYMDVGVDNEAGEVDFFFVSTGEVSDVYRGSAGLLQIGLPMRAFIDRVETISGYYLEICDVLKPLHGSAGFGLTAPVHRGTTHTLAMAGEYHDAAKTFPCLEHNAQEDTTNHPDLENVRKPENGFQEWLRTTGWMTVVSDCLLDKIGGRDVVATTLTGEGIDVRFYQGGLAIVASENPVLGYEGHGPIPPAYGTIARLLKPVRCEFTQPSMLFSPTAYISYEERDLAFKAWRERFDKVGF